MGRKAIRSYAVLLVALAACGALLLRFHSGPQAAPEKPGEPAAIADLSGLDPGVQEALWSSYIDRVGVAQAYGDFKELYGGAIPFYISHGMMHILGDVLYKKMGLDAVGICDSSFSFACFHQVFLDAVASKGLSVVPSLVETCEAKFPNQYSDCEHGIGHGIAEYYGTTDQGLLKGIAFCADVRGMTVGFCQSGVFMQYFQIPNFDANETVRPIDPRDPYAPCDTIVPQEFRHNCYLGISTWWINTYDLQKTVSLCDHIPAAYRDSCYSGAGKTFSLQNNFNFDVDKIAAQCDALPEEEERGYCLIGVAQSFAYYYRQNAAASAVCAKVPADLRGSCKLPNQEGF